MGRRRLVDGWAVQVLDELRSVGGGPLKAQEISDRTGLDPAQVYRAFGYLRDFVDRSDNLSWIAGRDGVAISGDYQEVRSYVKTRAGSASTQLRRVLTGSVQPMATHAPPSVLRDVNRIEIGIERLIQDLELVVTEIEEAEKVEAAGAIKS